MTKYSIDIYKNHDWTSIALCSDIVPLNAMVSMALALGSDPAVGADDVAIYDMDTGEILWGLSSAEDYNYPDDWDDEVGFNPYEGCYDYDC